MSNRLVICSSPEDDDYVGEQHNADFVNITETSLPKLRELVKDYEQVICVHNSASKLLSYNLKIIANQLNLPFDVDNTFHIDTSTNKNINANKILFLGCSHTYGIGHASRDTVYTHLSSKALGKTPLVDAGPGLGNMDIESRLNRYNLRNATVVVQFSDMYRIQFNNIPKSAKDYNLHESFIFTDEVLASEFVARVKRIVNLLRANNCKFCFLQIKSLYNEKVQILHEIDSVLSMYKEFIFWEYKWIKDYGIDGSHFGPETHKIIANEVVNFLNGS